jgi:TolB-like protein
MDKKLDRKLAAILYADVAGYSRLTGEDEEGTHRRLSRCLDLIAETIKNHDGNVVHYAGDAVLADFSTVSNGLACAVDIQRRLREPNTDLPEDRRVEFRIGLNLGEVIVDRGDIYGDGVNVAARLESLADAGGICISESVRTAIGKKLPHDYEFMGEQQVKNITEPVRAYRVLMEPREQQKVISPEKSALELPDKPSIAVLPFDNMSGDPEQEYFSDGITEDIITELSRFSSLFVIARNSSFAFKGQSIDVKSIARELGVRYMLEGSVRRAGNRLRINAQLLDTEMATHIWAERYNGSTDDIFELQDEITRNIVGSIAPQIEIAEVERGRGLPAANLTSYELSLKAQALFYDWARSGSPKLMEETIEGAQAALDIDPRNTLALWIQAYAYAMQYLYRWGPDPDESLARAWDITERFIQMDSSNPKAYMLRGIVYTFRREFDAAIADYRRAFSLNPNFAMNLVVMAWGESLAGLTKEAREHAELGLRLSPRDLDLWLGDAYLALLQASFAEGDFEEAKKWGLLAVQMGTKAPIRRALMIACCAYTDDPADAARHAQELKAFTPDFIPSILSGAMTLYKMPEHNTLLVDGLRKAGFAD